MPAAPKSPQSKKPGAPKAKGAVRAKSGCYTCRIRKKKCDEQLNQDGHCETCVRLHLQCLGFGAKRPEWLRESQKVSEARDKIKAFLAAQGMIKGRAESGHYGSEYDRDLPFLRLEDDNFNTPSSSSSNDMPPTPTLSLVPLDPHESTIREQRTSWIGLDYPPGLHMRGASPFGESSLSSYGWDFDTKAPPVPRTEISSTIQSVVLPALPAPVGYPGHDNPEEIKTGTFAIYLPCEYDERPQQMQHRSFTRNDLTDIQTNLSLGGCVVSIHEPAEAASWIENNWDSTLLTSIQTSGCGGPLAWMLSPEEPALALFGSYENPMIGNMAKLLADLSGFPVVVRPASDNPAFTLLTQDMDSHNGYHQFNNLNIDNNNVGRRDEDDEDEIMIEDERTPGESGNSGGRENDHDDAESNDKLNAVDEQEPSRGDGGAQGGGDGDGGSGGSTTVDDKWESPLHRTRVKLQLKLSPAHTHVVTIGCTYKFTINRETEIPIDLADLTRPLSQPEVIALVDFEIETRPRETQVDRSYASIGFVAHRRESIIQRKFLPRGFEHPDKLYKHGQQRQTQRGFRGALGFSEGSPLATATFSYDRSNGATLEATDSKVMPKCRVDYEMGDEWDQDSKSYSSYNIAYQLQDIRLDAERSKPHPLEVRVGMGINLQPAGSEKPLPKISFVNRNQMLIWVSDPTSKARIRGVVVLMSSYFDSIRAKTKLSIYEQEEIGLGTGSLNVPKTKEEDHKPGTISLSIAQVQNQGSLGSNKLRGGVPAFITKFGQRSSASPSTCIPPHEYLARGWDVDNDEWRNVLWPALDKHFRAADLEGTSPVWKIQCPWKKALSTGTNMQP